MTTTTAHIPLTQGTTIAYLLSQGTTGDKLDRTCRVGVVEAVANDVALISGHRIHRDRIHEVTIQRQPATQTT